MKSVVAIENVRIAIDQIAQTALRKVVGEAVIATIPGRGYRFVARAEPVAPTRDGSPSPTSPPPSLRTNLPADLPATPPAAPAPPPAAPAARRGTPGALVVLWTVWACVFGLNLVVWTLVSLGNGRPDSFWPMWLLVPATVLLAVTGAVRVLRRR